MELARETPAEMRARARAFAREAAEQHARAGAARDRRDELHRRIDSQRFAAACPECGRSETPRELEDEAKTADLEFRRFAGMGNHAGVMAMFWRECADRAEAARETADA